MKGIIKQIIVKFLTLSGLPFIFREYFQKKKVTIIVLHNPGSKNFKLLLNWLSEKYNIISLDHYLSFRKGLVTLPYKPLIITLDDGHSNNYSLLPIIKSTGIPVTIFLCSGIINTNRHFWFRAVGNKVNSETLKLMPNHFRLEILSMHGFSPQKEFQLPQALNKDQIMEMKEYVNFQSHTVFHPCLNQCKDEESWNEVYESKVMLETDYGLTVNAIAYPNGDYTEREIEYVRKAGYECGLGVRYGYNGKKTDLFKLRRFSVNDTESLGLLAIKSSGIWAYLSYIFKTIPRRIKYKILFSTGKFIRIFILVNTGMEYFSSL